MNTLQNSFMSAIFFLVVITSKVCFCQQNEYWQMPDGYFGKYLVQLDSTVVFITNDVELMELDGYMDYFPAISMLQFNNNGEQVSGYRFNPQKIDFIEFALLFSGENQKSVNRLSNGNFIMGGHGILNLDSLTKSKHASEIDRAVHDIPGYYPQSNSRVHEFPTLNIRASFENQKDDDPSMIHPLIFTFNSTLDSLLRIDTLLAVPYYGSVNLLHEIALDTLIVGYHKTDESTQVIMQTDSLFNIRWSTEFGFKPSWWGEIYDAIVTENGDILVIVIYKYMHPYFDNGWVLHQNVIYKFSGQTGKMLWEKEVERNGHLNTFATFQPIHENSFLLAYDDCCPIPPDVRPRFMTFHKETGLHLRVIDEDGNTLQEKSLVDFLSAFIYTWDGENYTGSYEDPDEAYPWYIPLSMIRADDNSFIITGMHKSVAPGTHLRGFLIKVDENLEPKWVRVFQIDEKNYPYTRNWLLLNCIAQLPGSIFTGGVFWSHFSDSPSPYYPGFWASAILIALDQHGCWEPGCHLTDHIEGLDGQEQMRLFPNPVIKGSVIQIEIPGLDGINKTLFVSDLMGKQVIRQHFRGTQIGVNTNELIPGTYLVYVFGDNMILKAEKLVVAGN